jgi:tetratricopeptide (TPR) repeat protein
MQDPDSIRPNPGQPQESAEIVRLRAELDRLKAKRLDSTDPDIMSVFDMRITEIEATLATLSGSVDEPEEPEEPEESEEITKLRLELQKLEEKRAKTKDKNVIAVLDMRIMQIQPTLPPLPASKRPKKETEKAADEDLPLESIPLPTKEEAAKAEQLIRQSMLEKRRGNVVGATDLLKKAAEAAPGSSVVLEALGDDLLERKLSKQARQTYKRALQIDPKNVGLERKYAQTVLQSTTTMSVEDQLRYGMSDSLFITGEDNVAGLTAARMLNAIVPGVGQMVLGKTTKGVILFVAWAILVGMFALWNKDFLTLMFYIRGKGAAPNPRVLVPMIGMAAVWIASMMDLSGGKSKAVARHSKVERPKPPVDLPFD